MSLASQQSGITRKNLSLNTPGQYFQENDDQNQRKLQTREQWLEEKINAIIQCEPVKKEVLEILSQEHEITGPVLLRKIKQNGRYMGSVTMGMIMYNLIELLGSDMISRHPYHGDFIYEASVELQKIYSKIHTKS